MPPSGPILDYGCGTGMAGRRVIAAWPEQVRKLMLWDRSQAAMQFARSRASALFPGLPVQTSLDDHHAPGVMVVSHVLNELAEADLERLLALASKAKAVLWVEPGTAAVSKALIEVRKRLLAPGHSKEMPFRPVAPCPHALNCGLNAPENERHWCHHFAKVPHSIFQDAGWGRFSKTLEVDLRTIPFSYLVLDRRPLETGAHDSRLIGHPRHYKGYDKVLSCQAEGVQELVLQKRDAPELYKEMKKNPGSLYRWNREEEKIVGGTRIF